MTNEEILKKAIEKALKNDFETMIRLIPTYALELSEDKVIQGILAKRHINDIIFSHDFARAFWGEGQEIDSYGDEVIDIWQYHLQIMVLEKEPLKYLAKYL